MPTEDEIIACIEKLRKEAEPGRYNLNPNIEDLKMIIEGYLENDKKFSYPACPCRLASGNFQEDKDIICPCDYRDADIVEFGGCYCSLYVDDDIASGQKEPQPVPERRIVQPQDNGSIDIGSGDAIMKLDSNVWRCPVCGYLCAKDQPPPKCPICGVSRDRFELFIEKS